MKILIVNKFLHPNGGSESYVFSLGKYLSSIGHEVQYFGMDHEGRIVGNSIDAYVSDMDFHHGSILSKSLYPIKTIYSFEARNQIRKLLDSFHPDVVHLNNFNYQITPSIIEEIVKWKKEKRMSCRIVYTAHDYNLICPNHMLYNPNTEKNCENCLGGNYLSCIAGKCIHGSLAKSLVGATEGFFWKLRGIYQYIDVVICCSGFMKNKMDTNPVFRNKTVLLYNFIDKGSKTVQKKQPYVLYFGRFSKEKGILTLLDACKELKDIQFVFAGGGPLEASLSGIENVKNVGFKKGSELESLISSAKFSIYPSEWYENCPLSVMESQSYGTPVIGADIGGIPELIRPGKTGELFSPGDKKELEKKIRDLWQDEARIKEYSVNCVNTKFYDVEQYCRRLIKIYMNNYKEY